MTKNKEKRVIDYATEAELFLWDVAEEINKRNKEPKKRKKKNNSQLERILDQFDDDVEHVKYITLFDIVLAIKTVVKNNCVKRLMEARKKKESISQ